MYRASRLDQTLIGLIDFPLLIKYLLLRRSAKLRIRAAQECSKVAFGCPEVVSEFVRDIFEFFYLIFSGEINNYEKVLPLEEIKNK